MLAGVAGQDDPATVVVDVVKKLLHLLRPNLPGLIHDDDRTTRQLLLREEFAHGLRAGHSVTLEVDDLLALRRDDLQRVAGGSQAIRHFPERVTFSRARAAAKQGHEIAGTQDVFDRLALILVETGIRDWVRLAQPPELTASFPCRSRGCVSF